MLYFTYAGQIKPAQISGMNGHELALAETILAEMIGT